MVISVTLSPFVCNFRSEVRRFFFAMMDETHQSTCSAESSSFLPYFVHVLLLSDDMRNVLMLESNGGSWKLPFYQYPNRPYCKKCCEDLRRTVLNLQSNCWFTISVELFGDSVGELNGDVGYLQLAVAERHGDDITLSEKIQWKSSAFIRSALCGSQRLSMDERAIWGKVLEIVESPEPILHNFADPRYNLGWFDKASEWCSCVVAHSGTGAVEISQEEVSPTSTILKASLEQGDFYLKAPAIGTNEVTIVHQVAMLFSESVPQVLDVSINTHCFVSKGFIPPDLEDEELSKVVMEMGSLQIGALKHLDSLKAAGCDVRGSDQLAKCIMEWTTSSDVKRIFARQFPRLQRVAPKLRELCSRLRKSKVPLTLIHGDLMPHNATRRSRSEDGNGVLIFDWQYSCIAHPFCDLHEAYAELSEEAVDEYLELWSKYEDKPTAKRNLEAALPLGWCLKMWATLVCLRRSNPQELSPLEEFFFNCFERACELVEGGENDLDEQNVDVDASATKKNQCWEC